METPAFLRKAKEESVGEIAELSSKVQAYKLVLSRIDQVNKQLEELQKQANRLGQEEIPNLLLQHNVSEIRLQDGTKVIVKEETSCSIPDEKRSKFFAFLEEREESDIIKLQLQFKKMPQERLEMLFDFLNGYDFEYESERGVHPQTLKKYVKGLLGLDKEKEEREEGIAEGKFLRKSDIEDVLNVFTFFTTKLKE